MQQTQAMRVLLTSALICLWAGEIWAQPGATGAIAALNAEAKASSETDPARSLAVALRAQAAAREAEDVRGEAEALNYIAYGYRNQSLLDLAMQSAEDSVRLYIEAGDPWGESQGYNTLGLIEADAGRFAEALEYHLKALAIREREGDTEGLSYSFNNLGNAYRNMGEYDTALEYHKQGLALKIELGNPSSEAYSHHNIGLVYFAMGDDPNALAAYRRGLEIRERLNDPRALGVSLNAIGQVEARTDPAAALRTYARALTLRRDTGDERGEMATELNLGDVYQSMNDLTRATAAFNRALALGERIDAPLMQSNALRALAEVRAARGDYRAAYQHQLQHQEARDRMFNQDNAERFQRLQVAHEADRQQRQIQLLEQEGALRDAELAQVRTIRTALAVIAGLVIVSLALLYGRFRLKHQSEVSFRAQAAALSEALQRVRTLKGMLPICASCKKIRDDNGYWTQVEAYVSSHSGAEFTHSICPSCLELLYPDDHVETPHPDQPAPRVPLT
ncbi:MAG TPA: tetratricopeptide repeat protein [Vicinamibacterales bacterium]|nr:tetratricopeptide repeat protein [Vicinamibacterales bacterium]